MQVLNIYPGKISNELFSLHKLYKVTLEIVSVYQKITTDGSTFSFTLPSICNTLVFEFINK